MWYFGADCRSVFQGVAIYRTVIPQNALLHSLSSSSEELKQRSCVLEGTVPLGGIAAYRSGMCHLAQETSNINTIHPKLFRNQFPLRTFYNCLCSSAAWLDLSTLLLSPGSPLLQLMLRILRGNLWNSDGHSSPSSTLESASVISISSQEIQQPTALLLHYEELWGQKWLHKCDSETLFLCNRCV